MATKISIVNNKGGVGKSISSQIIAEILAGLDKRVLVIDLDESANITAVYNLFHEDSSKVLDGAELPEQLNIAELLIRRFTEKEDVLQTIRHTELPTLDIIPSSKRLARTSEYMQSSTGNTRVTLKRALKSIESDYDYIIMDNSPHDDIITINSIFAADVILVPVRIGDYAFRGLDTTTKKIEYLKEEFDTELPVPNAFICAAETNTKSFKQVSQNYDNILMDSYIRKTKEAADIELAHARIMMKYPKGILMKDYGSLIIELGLLDEATSKTLANYTEALK